MGAVLVIVTNNLRICANGAYAQIIGYKEKVLNGTAAIRLSYY